MFRYEDPEVYARSRSMGPKTPGSPPRRQPGVPVVYKLDMKDPRGFFAAQRFLMRDNDVLYVSNAASTDLQKLFSVFTRRYRDRQAVGRSADGRPCN